MYSLFHGVDSNGLPVNAFGNLDGGDRGEPGQRILHEELKPKGSDT
jgi:hypothetical protein